MHRALIFILWFLFSGPALAANCPAVLTTCPTVNANIGNFGGALNANGGGLLLGTFTGNPTFSGNPIFSGAPTFTGTAPSGSAITALFASPPAIGSVVPGAVSSLSGALNGTLGATTPRSAAVTTLSASGISALSNQITQSFIANWNLTSSNQGACATQFFCSVTYPSNAGGASSPLTAYSTVASFNYSDQVYTTGTVYGFQVNWNVPSTTSISGSRVAFTAGLNVQAADSATFTGTIVGTTLTVSGVTGTIEPGQSIISGAAIGTTIVSGSGTSWVVSISQTVGPVGMSSLSTWTGNAISGGGGIGAFNSRNMGGTSSLYTGSMTGFNSLCQMYSGATFIDGCLVQENDTSMGTGTSYAYLANTLFVTLNTHQARSYSNDNYVLGISAQTGALADMKTGLKFGDQSSANAMDNYARLIFLSPSQGAVKTTIAAAMDYSNAISQTSISRTPFQADFTLQASGVTGLKRLTTDGASADGFIYDSYVTSLGSGFTGNPTVNLNSACSGAAVVALANGAGTIAKIGTTTPGSAVKAECAISSITGGGGGTGVVGVLVIAGNTLNLPINSTNTVACQVASQDTNGDSYGFSISFGVTMGATASTTALVGSPTWTQVYPASGTLMALSVAADTILGAVNISATPSSATFPWTLGGKCTVSSTSQVL